jgi:predicted small metal-binding protein
MGNYLNRIECDPKCGFIVQSHDEKEVLEIARKHAKEKHHENVTDQQLRSMMTTDQQMAA